MNRPTQANRLRAFTLIELLVVIAIIAILIGLLLPAVQKVREAGSRMNCQNNLKQLGLAMHNYHDNRGALPWGNQPTPRTSWVPLIWPYIEQQGLASTYNYAAAFHVLPNSANNSSTANLIATQIKTYFCPSDRGSPAYWMGDAYYRSRGNYVVNFGNATDSLTGGTPPAAIAPFSQLNSSRTPRLTKFKDVTDGHSNTLLLSEVLMAPDNSGDMRGDIFNDDRGCANFMTLSPPNSPNPDVIMNYGTITTNDPLMPYTLGGNTQKAARSKHTGGVNVVLCDGSVRFVANTIDPATWSRLGPMNDGIPIDGF